MTQYNSRIGGNLGDNNDLSYPTNRETTYAGMDLVANSRSTLSPKRAEIPKIQDTTFGETGGRKYRLIRVFTYTQDDYNIIAIYDCEDKQYKLVRYLPEGFYDGEISLDINQVTKEVAVSYQTGILHTGNVIPINMQSYTTSYHTTLYPHEDGTVLNYVPTSSDYFGLYSQPFWPTTAFLVSDQMIYIPPTAADFSVFYIPPPDTPPHQTVTKPKRSLTNLSFITQLDWGGPFGFQTLNSVTGTDMYVDGWLDPAATSGSNFRLYNTRYWNRQELPVPSYWVYDTSTTHAQTFNFRSSIYHSSTGGSGDTSPPPEGFPSDKSDYFVYELNEKLIFRYQDKNPPLGSTWLLPTGEIRAATLQQLHCNSFGFVATSNIEHDGVEFYSRSIFSSITRYLNKDLTTRFITVPIDENTYIIGLRDIFPESVVDTAGDWTLPYYGEYGFYLAEFDTTTCTFKYTEGIKQGADTYQDGIYDEPSEALGDIPEFSNNAIIQVEMLVPIDWELIYER